MVFLFNGYSVKVNMSGIDTCQQLLCKIEYLKGSDERLLFKNIVITVNGMKVNWRY